MVLRHDHTLVVDTRRNLDIHALRLAVRTVASEGVMIQRHLDGGKLGWAFDAGLHMGRDPHVHALRAGKWLRPRAGQQSRSYHQAALSHLHRPLGPCPLCRVHALAPTRCALACMW